MCSQKQEHSAFPVEYKSWRLFQRTPTYKQHPGKPQGLRGRVESSLKEQNNLRNPTPGFYFSSTVVEIYTFLYDIKAGCGYLCWVSIRALYVHYKCSITKLHPQPPKSLCFKLCRIGKKLKSPLSYISFYFLRGNNYI